MGRLRLKTPEEIAQMREAGRVVALILEEMERMAVPGTPTIEMDRQAAEIAKSFGARMAFLGYRGYPANICVSINEQVVHGIPGRRRLVEGDIVSIDVGVELKGWFADAAATFPVGEVPEKVKKLLRVTKEALHIGIEHARVGMRLSQLAAAIQTHVESHGLSVVKDYVGHGIGRNLHEEPRVPNFVDSALLRNDVVFQPGLTIAIEPMVNLGTDKVKRLADGWTVVTQDGSFSAHFEHTVAITDKGPLILTAP